jgi:hypothetical protein
MRQQLSSIRIVMTCALLCAAIAMAEHTKGGAPDKSLMIPYVTVKATAQQEAKIKSLVEQLVLADRPASNRPTMNPGMKIYNAEGKEVKPTGDEKKAEEYRKRFEACQSAFRKISEFKVIAFPVLIKHLDDKRQSTNFRNHFLANSVGNACYWNIYYQLQDRPDNYSSYGEGRTGRDGRHHTKPYWEGTPFDEAGGIKQWIDRNKNLTYLEMQIKCLQWLLDKEKKIGASDANSYFENILPLEIRILERKAQAGASVEKELARLRRVLANRDASSIPADLLPAK